MSKQLDKESSGEQKIDSERITAELDDFIKNAKKREDYESGEEYNVSAELGYEIEPILKKIDKVAVDYSFDETNSKYINDLDGFLGVDVDKEDFYDFEAGRVDDDAYNDAVYRSRLQKIDKLDKDESLGKYGFAEGFNFFNVKYDVDDEDSEGTLTYTRDLLGDRKNVPSSMTTGLAELLMSKLGENAGTANGMESLADMPSFEEHMATKGEQEKNAGERAPTETAISAIAEELKIDEGRLREAFFEGDDEKIFEEARAKIKDKFNEIFIDSDYESMNNKEYFVLDILSKIHNKWCAENETAFFDPKQSDRRYKFLKFDLIGFDDASAYLPIVEPILEKIGIGIDIDNLEKQYDDYPLSIDSEGDRDIDNYYGYGVGDDWCSTIGCKFAETLYDEPSRYLSRGASEKIHTAIERDFDIAAEMTMQVGEHRATEEADYGSLWAYHERGEEGLDDYWLGAYDPFDTSKIDNNPHFTSQEYINDGWD